MKFIHEELWGLCRDLAQAWSKGKTFWNIPDRKNDTVKGQGTEKRLRCWSIKFEATHDKRGHQGCIKGIGSLGEICVYPCGKDTFERFYVWK